MSWLIALLQLYCNSCCCMGAYVLCLFLAVPCVGLRIMATPDHMHLILDNFVEYLKIQHIGKILAFLNGYI